LSEHHPVEAECGAQVFEIAERRIRWVISAVWGELVARREDMDVGVDGPAG
jgi:hypothetical protein